MATVVETFSGVPVRSSTCSLASVISASVWRGSISETVPTRVVLPTPKPPATTIFVAMGARVRSVCQDLRLSSVSTSTNGETPYPGEAAASETTESTEHPFQQSAVGTARTVTGPGAVHTDLSLVREVAEEHPDHAERHLQQRGDLGHRAHPAAQFDDGPQLRHDRPQPAVGELLALLGGFEGSRARHERLHEEDVAEAGTAAGERVRPYPGGLAVTAADRELGPVRHRALPVTSCSSDWRSSLRSSGVRTCPARPTNSAMWYATTLMSQSAEPCTPSSEPSLIDITNRLPSPIAIMVCRVAPKSMGFAARGVRLPIPETTVARSADEPRGPEGFASRASRASAFRSASEESRSSPSEETTATDWTPGTSSTRLVSRKWRLRASRLSPKVLGAVNCLPPRLCPPWLLRMRCCASPAVCSRLSVP